MECEHPIECEHRPAKIIAVVGNLSQGTTEPFAVDLDGRPVAREVSAICLPLPRCRPRSGSPGNAGAALRGDRIECDKVQSTPRVGYRDLNSSCWHVPHSAPTLPERITR